MLNYARSYLFNDDCHADPDEWTREKFIEMDERFVDRLEQAFELGLESRASARLATAGHLRTSLVNKSNDRVRIYSLAFSSLRWAYFASVRRPAACSSSSSLSCRSV